MQRRCVANLTFFLQYIWTQPCLVIQIPFCHNIFVNINANYKWQEFLLIRKFNGNLFLNKTSHFEP